MSFPALQATAAAGAVGTPLDYEDSLVDFFDAENGVTESSNVVSDWDGQGSSINLTVPSGHIGPDFVSSDQNGLPGLSFEDPGSGGDRLRRKLSSADAAFDQYFNGAGFKGISFAGRWDQTTDLLGFNTDSVIVQKGFEHNVGWKLDIQPNGTVRFRHRMNDGSIWQIAASAFYNAGDLVLGSVKYSGGNSNSSGILRLYNGSTFVETGNITLANNSSKASEAAFDLSIGNTLEDGNTNTNGPFEGSLFGVWFTKPFSRSLDDGFMRRWVS